MSKRAKDWVLIEALALGASQQVAADLAGVSTRLIRRRLQEEWFVDAVARREEELAREGREMSAVARAEATARLLAATISAVDALREMVEEGPPRNRVWAATAILDRVPLHEVQASPSPTSRHDGVITAEIRRRVEEVEEEQRRSAENPRHNRTQQDKSGQNDEKSTFPDHDNPFRAPP
jgi:hypothetical protein